MYIRVLSKPTLRISIVKTSFENQKKINQDAYSAKVLRKKGSFVDW